MVWAMRAGCWTELRREKQSIILSRSWPSRRLPGRRRTALVSGPERMKLSQDFRALRAKAIYDEDRGKPLRKSHENPAIKALYEEYLIKPLGEKSHHLLHTHYQPRVKYPALAGKECNG